MRGSASRLAGCTAFVAGVALWCLPCAGHAADMTADAPSVAETSSKRPVSESSDASSEAARSPVEQRLWKAVSAVTDPEIEIGIVDLGLVRRIAVNEAPGEGEPHVILTMILTSPLCPYAKELLRDIRDAIQTELPQRRLKVIIDGKTRWTPALMTEEGKRRFAGEH